MRSFVLAVVLFVTAICLFRLIFSSLGIIKTYLYSLWHGSVCLDCFGIQNVHATIFWGNASFFLFVIAHLCKVCRYARKSCHCVLRAHCAKQLFFGTTRLFSYLQLHVSATFVATHTNFATLCLASVLHKFATLRRWARRRTFTFFANRFQVGLFIQKTTVSVTFHVK